MGETTTLLLWLLVAATWHAQALQPWLGLLGRARKPGPPVCGRRRHRFGPAPSRNFNSRVVMPADHRIWRQHQRASSSTFTGITLLHAVGKNDDNAATAISSSPPSQEDLLMLDVSRTLTRISWLSWWSQVILTTVAGIILVFARNVTGRAHLLQHNMMRATLPNFFLSGVGVMISCGSIVWTWGDGARLSKRLIRRPATRMQAANMLRRAVQVGTMLNLLGLLVTLLAAEEIVGSLAIKVLTNRPLTTTGIMTTMEGLQPLDILIVQANTNTLLSHFCSLSAFLYLTRTIHRLDPPSKDGRERNGRV